MIDLVAAELPPGPLGEARADGDVLLANAPYRPETSIFAYIPGEDDKDSALLRPQTSCAGLETRCTWEHTFGGVLQDKASYGNESMGGSFGIDPPPPREHKMGVFSSPVTQRR